MSATDTSTFDWVMQQILSRGPQAETESSPNDDIRALVGAIANIEQGGSIVFGKHLDGATRAALAPLAGIARDVLGQWLDAVVATHGEKGRRFVNAMAARGNVVLAGMSSTAFADAAAPPAEADQAVFDALSLAVEERRVRAGTPDPSALHDFAVRYEAAEDTKLPVGYLQLLARFNGIRTPFEDEDEESFQGGFVPPRRLGEPSLYPLDIEADHLELQDVGFPDIVKPFLFGGLVDTGYLVFDAGTEGAPVFWIPQQFAHEAPAALTASLSAYFTLWAAVDWSLQAVLRRCRVPGWGA